MKKKTSKTPEKLDIIESQIRLYQYCNDANKKIHDMEMWITNLGFQVHILKKENFEIKSLLQGISTHLQSIKNSMAVDSDWTEEEQPVVLSTVKSLPLHDDVMTNCDMCGRNHHANLSSCPKCGFKRMT